jgi:hypothetical protein
VTTGDQVDAFAGLQDDAFDALTPSLRSDLLIRDVDGHAVAWSPNSAGPIALGPLSVTVLRLLDGDVSAGELVGDLSDVLEVDAATARHLLRRELAAFAGAGAIEGSTPWAHPDQSDDVFPSPPNP